METEMKTKRCPIHETVLNAAGNCLLCQHPELAEPLDPVVAAGVDETIKAGTFAEELTKPTNWTKGPWHQQEYGRPANPYIIAQTCAYPSPRTTVAWGTPTGGQGWPAVGDAGVFDRETVEANARLIAESPSLYCALAQLVDAVSEETFQENGGCGIRTLLFLNEARDVLARARGDEGTAGTSTEGEKR